MLDNPRRELPRLFGAYHRQHRLHRYAIRYHAVSTASDTDEGAGDGRKGVMEERSGGEEYGIDTAVGEL